MDQLLSLLLRCFKQPQLLPGTPMSEHEEFLAYAEEESRRTLADLSAAFASHFERALKVLTLLIGGAGAVAAYTVNNWSSLERPALWALLVLALGWSAIAAYLATWGMRSRLVSSGPDLVGMTNIYLQQAGSMQASTRADEAAQAMRKVRKSEINRRHQQTVAYATAVSEQTTDLRRAVVLAALSPALAIALWAVALWQM